MPYSVAEFDEAKQEAFISTVADAANVESFRVAITSITPTTEAGGRRLLAQGCEVLFRVRVPLSEKEDGAPPILEALSAVENMNTLFETRGLLPALRVAAPARIVRPQRSCAASSINGVHPTPFRAPAPCVHAKLLCCAPSPQSLIQPCIGSSCALRQRSLRVWGLTWRLVVICAT